jgi:hypothetical protein
VKAIFEMTLMVDSFMIADTHKLKLLFEFILEDYYQTKYEKTFIAW